MLRHKYPNLFEGVVDLEWFFFDVLHCGIRMTDYEAKLIFAFLNKYYKKEVTKLVNEVNGRANFI